MATRSSGSGVLYLVSTPIGNLEDITLRALRVLKESDLVAAEDTRITRKLFSRFSINTPLRSYHEHNESRQTTRLLEALRGGDNIALVAAAGTPVISDPGWCLVRAAVEAGINVQVVPGPSAAIAALAVSGLAPTPFSFTGFLPRKKSQAADRLRTLAAPGATLVLYESPRRLLKTLATILEVLGNRQVAVARELTKKFEEVVRGSAKDVLGHFNQGEPRGEIVIVVEGRVEETKIDDGDLKRKVLERMGQGLTKKDAIQATAAAENVSRRRVYESVKTVPGRRKSAL